MAPVDKLVGKVKFVAKEAAKASFLMTKIVESAEALAPQAKAVVLVYAPTNKPTPNIVERVEYLALAVRFACREHAQLLHKFYHPACDGIILRDCSSLS